jgi:ABC-type oligopeptide transport system ATPase subunit
VKIDLLENRRHLLVGATGSGKTHLGRALISNSPKYPVIIFDTKIDDAFESIPNSVIIDGLERRESRKKNRKKKRKKNDVKTKIKKNNR